MGKNEGMDTTNFEKRHVHDVYVADKQDQQHLRLMKEVLECNLMMLKNWECFHWENSWF